MDKPAIMIGGASRSGTTLLLSILQQHPEIAGILESSLIEFDSFREFPATIWRLSVKERIKAISRLREQMVTSMYLVKAKGRDDIWGGLHRFFNQDEIINCTEVLDGYIYVDNEALSYQLFGSFVDALFNQFAKRQGKAIWAEKTPLNCWFIDFWFKCFGNLKFINLIRDGRDRVCSLTTVRWWSGDYMSAIEEWAYSIKKVYAAIQDIPDNVCISVRYEDLVERPQELLRGLLKFIGLPWHNNLLAFDISKESVGRWKKEIPVSVLDSIHTKYGDLLSKLRYEI